MISVKKGKTKDVYELPDGNYLMKLKDDATGTDGVFDPGANTVGLQIEGLGMKSLELTKYYFEKINTAGIFTHYISCDLDKAEMTVRPAEFFGEGGLEVICRLKAVGSFFRRYGGYIKEGADLDYLVEFTLKDDERGDPPASKTTLAALGIINDGDAEILRALVKKITKIISEDLKSKSLDLYDIKLEFGKINGEIALIDEISVGVMRVYKDGKTVGPTELNDFIFGRK